jgi:hypothetical protein
MFSCAACNAINTDQSQSLLLVVNRPSTTNRVVVLGNNVPNPVVCLPIVDLQEENDPVCCIKNASTRTVQFN